MGRAAAGTVTTLGSFFESYYRLRPVNATFTGIHALDDRLPDWSPSGLASAIDEMRRLREALNEPAPAPFSGLPAAAARMLSGESVGQTQSAGSERTRPTDGTAAGSEGTRPASDEASGDAVDGAAGLAAHPPAGRFLSYPALAATTVESDPELRDVAIRDRALAVAFLDVQIAETRAGTSNAGTRRSPSARRCSASCR